MPADLKVHFHNPVIGQRVLSILVAQFIINHGFSGHYGFQRRETAHHEFLNIRRVEDIAVWPVKKQGCPSGNRKAMSPDDMPENAAQAVGWHCGSMSQDKQVPDVVAVRVKGKQIESSIDQCLVHRRRGQGSIKRIHFLQTAMSRHERLFITRVQLTPKHEND